MTPPDLTAHAALLPKGSAPFQAATTEGPVLPDLLPLTRHTRRSLYYLLLEAGAPPALIEEACGLLDGIHACHRYVRTYSRQTATARQARMYKQTALEIERTLHGLIQAQLAPHPLRTLPARS